MIDTAKGAPNLASAVNIGAFNLGNVIGVALGGAVINAGLGYPAIFLASAAMGGRTADGVGGWPGVPGRWRLRWFKKRAGIRSWEGQVK